MHNMIKLVSTLALLSYGSFGFIVERRSVPTRAINVRSSHGDDTIIARAASVAEIAARAAGTEILEGMGAMVKSEKLNHKDIVTAVDGRCQDIIRREIEAAFPFHFFLGEEDVPPGAAEAAAAIESGLALNEWCWIVDPVDGTTNLAAGLPLVTTSIALARNGIVQVGVVFDPSHGECFTAIRGKGAYLNGERFKDGHDNGDVSVEPPLSSPPAPPLALKDAVLCVGCPPLPSAFQRNVHVIASLGPKCRGVRMLSSAALIYCWVALGRIGAYVATDINAWDFAAGKLIVEETVGGVCSNHEGAPLRLTDRDTLCSSGGLHDEVLGALKEALAMRK